MKKHELEMIKTALRVADENLTDEGYKPIPSIKKAIEIVNKELLQFSVIKSVCGHSEIDTCEGIIYCKTCKATLGGGM